MRNRVEVTSFEAVERFRASIIAFVETANAAMSTAESEIGRTITWLETEQLPHWKAVLRTTADELEQAKTAYRQKALFKDATGARHTAIDELRAVRRIEAKREEVERRAKATRRNLRELQRELTLYQGGVQQLRGMVNGTLPMAVEELRGVVEQLEQYLHVAPAAAPPVFETSPQGMGRDSTAFAPEDTLEPSPERIESADEEADDARLRHRTPGPAARAKAPRTDLMPSLPHVPAEATDALGERLDKDGPGRYDLMTVGLRAADAGSGELYFERRAPAGSGDSGWHIGPAAIAVEPGPCATITVGRLAAQRPELAALLAMPAGTLMRATAGRLTRVVDPLGRTVWRAQPAPASAPPSEGAP